MFSLSNSAKRYWSSHDMGRALLLGISAAMVLLLIWLASTTLFNTISGDDMVYERTLNSASTLISEPLRNYATWTARLTNIFTLNLLFSFTPEQLLVHSTLLFSLALVLLSLWYLVASVSRRVCISHPRLFGFAPGSALTLSLCVFSLATYDNFYWMAGVVTYIIPLALFGAISGRLLQKKEVGKFSLITLGILSLIMGLYNEAFVLQALAVITVMFGFTMLKLGPKQAIRKVALRYAPLFIGLLAAGIVMKFAPGTDFREHLNQTLAPVGFDHSLIGLLDMSVRTTIHELYVFLSHNWAGLSLTLSIATVGVLISRPSEWLRKNAAYVIGASTLVPPVAFFTMAFGFHYAYQPEITHYSLITANFLTYLAVVLVTLCVAQYIPRRKSLLFAFITGAIIISGIASLIIGERIQQINQLIKLQQKEFNKTNSYIISAKESGKTEINIGTSERYFTYCVPEVGPETWCNRAYTQYYGVKSIVATHYIDYYSVEQELKGNR